VADRRRREQETTAQRQTLIAVRQYIPQLEDEIAKREKTVAGLARGLEELELLTKDLSMDEERSKLIESRMNALQVELQAPPRARVLEPAMIADTPQWQRYAKMAVVPIVCATGVVMFIGWLDLRGGRVNKSLELQAHQLRVLADVPAVRKRALKTFRTPDNQRQPTEIRQFTDAVDMAREMLVPILPNSGGYVLAVTSAGPGEGKTAITGHLAVRLASTGRRVLVVDADTRNPQLHNLFGVSRHGGFWELVRGDAELADLVRPGPVPGFDVLPVGGRVPEGHRGILPGRVPAVIAKLREHYDIVVVDTAPALVAPETLLLSRYADGVLLTVMRDVSRIRDVLACSERLADVHANVLGVIFSGERCHRYGTY
jgi:capsular exopolysaccharide synthesis family protein